MATTVKCPSCGRESGGGNFCTWCAARLDASSAETALMPGGQSAPHLSSSSSVDEGRFLPGTVLAGRYRIAGLLGRGGMGEVYRATDLTLGQAEALKFLPEALARDERALARFYNEVRIARQVTHPNVCRVYDIGQVEGQHYISMEFVDGEDLSSLLRRIGRLPVDKALETARKLCAGLASAHERSVLHRDLKPANIMIDDRGQVIIMDFGLAGLSDQVHGDIRSGTPAYMSPEQLAGTEVTTKSDIYSLGLVLYELFTGKRAFEAGSLVELMDLQQKATPLSITTLVKELDPAVERVILRCLAPDPKQRPASALAIAVALPGGDPLAAALAAGETPSPELVAAAGETEGLRPRVALGWLAAALAGVAAYALLAPSQDVTAKLPLANTPEALARDARTMLRDFGYTARPADSAYGFSYDDRYRDYLKQHPVEATARWQNPASGEPPLVLFWYREASQELMAARGMNVAVTWEDPPMEISGNLRVKLNPEGKLRLLEAVPPQVEGPAIGAAAADWSRLFAAAGLDMTGFQPAEPQWTPLANWDQRAAWTRDRLRVEAAAWRGRPVSFRMVGPWTVAERMKPSGGQQTVLNLIVVYTALVVSCVIAWFNFRARKADLREANRLAAIYWSCSAASHLLAMHHSATQLELSRFWRSVASAGINAGVGWVLYLALEPWVRRRWPQTMISWSRFTVKGARDPLVGCDLLYGVTLAPLVALAVIGSLALQPNFVEPLTPQLEALSGVRYIVGDMLGSVGAFVDALLIFFILFVLRVILPKEWMAVAAFVVIVAAINVDYPMHSWVGIIFPIFNAAVWAVVLLRFGLLTAMAGDAVVQMLLVIPRTLDISAWYAGLSMVPLILIGLLAVYAFRLSLGGRRLIQLPD
jgi:serine/threonine-protein kinase